MAGVQASASNFEIAKLMPGASGEAATIESIARFHRRCLPGTASSQAGATAVEALYRAVLHDTFGIVFWSSRGGFLAATLDLRATEKQIRHQMPLSISIRLVLRHLLSPGHLISRWRWEHDIPRAGAAYILTVGSVPALEGDRTRLPGAAILEEALQEFRASGARVCLVDTEAANKRARSFYLKNGFREVKHNAGQVLLSKELT